MSLLPNTRHEQLAQLVARGDTATSAYLSIYGASKGAAQSAGRLLRNAQIRLRVAELTAEISSKLLNRTIRDREFCLNQLENRYELLDQVREERGADPDMQVVPGGKTGLMVRDYKGLGALQAVYKLDTGWLSEKRAIETHVGRLLGWDVDAAAAGNTAVQVNVTFVSPGGIGAD